jgi:predicted nucleotidyltransferase
MDPRAAPIKDFLTKVKESFDPEFVLLFGSRARKDELKGSDFDILVVSKKFEGIHFLQRISMLYQLWDYDYDLDVLGYTPEEFRRKKEEVGIVRQAVKEGVKV